MPEDTDLTNAIDRADSGTNGSFLDYLGPAAGLTNTILGALNVGDASKAAALNANAAALNAVAADKKSASLKKLAVLGVGALVVIVLLVVLFRRK